LNSASQKIPVYVFRGGPFSPAGNTVVSAADLDAVVKVYGAGGIHNSAGLSKAFRGAVFFRNDSGQSFLGVWGARKASKFRSALKQAGLNIELVRSPPPARLIWWATE
jgi:hypothetical protein